MTDIIRDKARQTLLRAGEIVREAAYDEAPKVTTDLARSILVVPDLDLAVRVGPAVDYGVYVHEGTGIHGPKGKAFVIQPRKKKALKFKFKGRNIVVGKVVNPGQKPNPFLDRAYDRTEDEVADLIADEMGDAVLAMLETGVSRNL